MANRESALKSWISRYNLYINGKCKEAKIVGWRTALAHARNHENPLFEPNKVIEIVNVWTGEIITLREAEERAKKYDSMRRAESVNSGTT